jgi:hypothetical protein
MNAADAPHAAHVAGGVAAVQFILVVQVDGGGQRLSRAVADQEKHRAGKGLQLVLASLRAGKSQRLSRAVTSRTGTGAG